MKKRVLAGILWFFAAWYGWNLIASFVGVSAIAGPFVGAATGLLIAMDPLGRIWSRGTAQQDDRAPDAEPPVVAELA